METKEVGKISPSETQNVGKETEKVDAETQEQFVDSEDTKDPAISSDDDEDEDDEDIEDGKASQTKQKKRNKPHKKHFNYHGDFYPGSLWEYPYPYFHPIYGCSAPLDCSCEKEETPKVEAKPEAPPAPCEAKPDGKECGGEAPTAIKVKQAKAKQRQLVPSHYYGPPSAGWGGFQPGQTGCGWGVPYWLKRQLVPSHYYGPPSAGWGGFQPGQTGQGWGTPYWYKKRHGIKHGKHVKSLKQKNKRLFKSHHRQLIPSHYHGQPSARWGGFQSGRTGQGWGTPYWYKSHVEGKTKKAKHVKASRKFSVAGNDPCGLGHTGPCGWDSGFGAGYASTGWGAPNAYGWTPAAHFRGGPENVDFRAWFGPKSFGKQGWGGSGWVGNLIDGQNGQSFSRPGVTAGWGIGGDMEKLDEKIGAGDMMQQNQGLTGYSSNKATSLTEGNLGGFSVGSMPDGNRLALTAGAGKLKHNSYAQSIGYSPEEETPSIEGKEESPSVEAKEEDKDIKAPVEAKEDKSFQQEQPEDTTGVVKSFRSPSDLMYQPTPSESDMSNYNDDNFIDQLENQQNQQEDNGPESPDPAEIMRDSNGNSEDIPYQQMVPESAELSRPGLPQMENNELDEGMQPFASRAQQRPTPESNEENGAEVSEEISEIMSQKPFKKPKLGTGTSKVTKPENSAIGAKEINKVSKSENSNGNVETEKVPTGTKETYKVSKSESSSGDVEAGKVFSGTKEANKVSQGGSSAEGFDSSKRPADDATASKETNKVSSSESSSISKDTDNLSSSLQGKETNKVTTAENIEGKDTDENRENKQESNLPLSETNTAVESNINKEGEKIPEKSFKEAKNKTMTKLKLSNLKESPMKKIEKKLKEVATSAIDIASKIKQTEELRKQEEAYSTIKSHAAKHPSRRLNSVKNEKSLLKSNLLSDNVVSSRTVKTKAQNEKPVTV